MLRLLLCKGVTLPEVPGRRPHAEYKSNFVFIVCRRLSCKVVLKSQYQALRFSLFLNLPYFARRQKMTPPSRYNL